MVLIFYALIASPFALAMALIAIYLIADHVGRDVPRWGDE